MTEKVSLYLPLPCGERDCARFRFKDDLLRRGERRLGLDYKMHQTVEPVSAEEADTALSAIRNQCNRTYGCALDDEAQKTIYDAVDELIAERETAEVRHA